MQGHGAHDRQLAPVMAPSGCGQSGAAPPALTREVTSVWPAPAAPSASGTPDDAGVAADDRGVAICQELGLI